MTTYFGSDHMILKSLKKSVLQNLVGQPKTVEGESWDKWAGVQEVGEPKGVKWCSQDGWNQKQLSKILEKLPNVL